MACLSAYGAALRAFAAGHADPAIVFAREGGGGQVIPVSVFFRSPADSYQLGTEASGFCRGSVLDVSAGDQGRTRAGSKSAASLSLP